MTDKTDKAKKPTKKNRAQHFTWMAMQPNSNTGGVAPASISTHKTSQEADDWMAMMKAEKTLSPMEYRLYAMMKSTTVV